MMRIRIRHTLVALPVALMLALTACGGDDGDGGDGSNDDVASADDGSVGETDDTGASDDGDDTTEPLSEEEFHNQLLDFAQCLRDHGADVDDPAPGEGIQMENKGPDEMAKNDAALEACEDVSPGAPPGAPDEAEEEQQMLDFAQCMRDNGVEKFEDPKPGEGTHLDNEIAEDPDFKDAEEFCFKEIMGGQPATQGQGA